MVRDVEHGTRTDADGDREETDEYPESGEDLSADERPQTNRGAPGEGQSRSAAAITASAVPAFVCS